MPTYSADVLPSSTGVNLGSSSLRWNLYAQNIDMSGVLTGIISASNINSIRYANQFSGADAGAKIVAAIADLPAGGGVVDARGLEGAQTVNADFFAGVARDVTVILGDGPWTFNVGVTLQGTLSNPGWATRLVGGSSWRGTTILAGANNLTLIDCAVFSYVANLSIDGNSKTGVTGIRMRSAATVRDVHINAVSKGLYYEGNITSTYGVFYSIADHVRMVACTNGIYMETLNGPGADWVNQNQVLDCQVVSSTGDGIYINGASGNLFPGLDVEGNNFGVRILDGQGNRFPGIWMEGNTTGDMYIARAATTSGTIVEGTAGANLAQPFTATGDITINTNALNITAVGYGTASKIIPGMIISVAGAGAAGATLVAGITAVSGALPNLAVTLDTNASTSVVGANTFLTGMIGGNSGYILAGEQQIRFQTCYLDGCILVGSTKLNRLAGTTIATLDFESGQTAWAWRDSSGNTRFSIDPATGNISSIGTLRIAGGTALATSNQTGTGSIVLATGPTIDKVTLTAAAPTVAASQLGLGATTAATATNGTGEAMKANVEGYIIANVAGTTVKIPYVKN